MDRDTVAPFSDLRGFSVGACLLLTLVWGLAGDAHALGLGRPQTQSALGQPLRLSFPVSLRSGESLEMDCVQVELMAGAAKLPAGVISVQLEGESDKNVRAIHVLSSVPIEEPILHASLSLGCPVQLTRQVTALLDPPASHDAGLHQVPQLQASSRILSPALRAALATADAKPEALMAAGLSEKLGQERLTASKNPKTSDAKSSAKQVSKASGGEGARNLVKRPRSAEAAHASAAQAAAGKEAGAPQLRLEAFDAGLALLSQSAAASAAEAAMTRLHTVESGLQSLQAEYRSNAQTLRVLREAQSTAPSALGLGASTIMPWVLAAFALALGGGLGFAIHGHSTRSVGREAKWWSKDAEAAAVDASREVEFASLALAEEAPIAGEQTPLADGPLGDGPLDAGRKLLSKAGVDEHTMSLVGRGEAEVLTAASEPTAETAGAEVSGVARISRLLAGDLNPEPISVQFIEHTESKFGPLDSSPEIAGSSQASKSNGVSVEELIDLEQQVDFFLVLGQDEAAVDLLQAQLKSRALSGAFSALPYLKLMDICQQRGDALAFAEIASQYAVQFKAQPPAWELSLESGRSLESYEEVILSLQSRWTDSGASMASLQQLLSCTEDRLSRFDLPALLDLLLLYSVARDRSEHEVRGEEIDLFLPLEMSDSAAKPTGFDLMATMVWQGQSTMPASVGVDILLDDAATGVAPASPKPG